MKENTKICILDVGCAGGIDPLFKDLIKNNKAYAYGFDANEDEINELIKKDKNKKNIKYYKNIVSDKLGKLEFFKLHTVGSIYRRKDREEFFNEDYKKILVDSITLDKFIIEKKIKDIIVLKVDIEGSEVSLLKGSNKILDNQVFCIKIEFNFHSPEKTNNFYEIHKILVNKNFQLMNLSINESNIFGIDGGDALYLKKINKLIINKKLNVEVIRNYIDLLIHLNKRDFANIIIKNCKEFFKKNDFMKLKERINDRLFFNNIVKFSFPKLSFFFFYMSMLFAGNKYNTKSFPKINRLKQSNLFFWNIKSKKVKTKYFSSLNKQIDRYNFLNK